MKLPNGYGSVIKLSRRRRKQYAARVTVGWTNDGQKIRKYIGIFRTREEAINALADYNQNPFDVDLRKLTFAEVWQQWCRHKYKGAPVKSVYSAAYKNLSTLHELIFSKIRKRHIQAVIDACPLSVQAKAHMKTLCTQMFKYAIDEEIVTTNYAALVELPAKVESEKHKPFSREELALIKTSDVDLTGRHMRGGIKTAAGKNRVIPLAKKIMPLIEGLYNPANEYLLTLDGAPLLNVQNFRSRVWDKSPLLSEHLPHDGRHTCATLMDNADVSLKIQQLILGFVGKLKVNNDISKKNKVEKTARRDYVVSKGQLQKCVSP